MRHQNAGLLGGLDDGSPLGDAYQGAVYGDVYQFVGHSLYTAAIAGSRAP